MLRWSIWFVSIFLASNVFAARICDVYIHGVMRSDAFDSMSRSVHWDSTLEIEEAALELAPKILKKIDECDPDIPVVLKAHDYGVSVVYYILGQGRRFEKFLPNHDFVQVYKNVVAVYSFAGAFLGTPLMDLICSDGEYPLIREIIGRTCVLSMSSSRLHRATALVPPPKIPFYLIYSTRSNGAGGEYLSAYRNLVHDNPSDANLNDGVIPLYSAKGCSQPADMFKVGDGCDIVDVSSFFDFVHTDTLGHFEMVDDVEFIKRYFSAVEEALPQDVDDEK